MNRTLVDGQPADAVSTTDRGLNYGDGVFRTLRVRGGQPHCWASHLLRLQSDCGRLGLQPPADADLHEQVIRVSHDGDWAVKIVVTRGSGRRGYAVDPDVPPRVIVSASPLPAHPAEYRTGGVRVRVCALRLSRQPALAGVKHLNRLENVLARREWDDPAIAEGLLLDQEGLVIEGIMSNLLAVFGRQLVTPDLSRCGVAGVQRQRALAGAERLGLVAGVEDLSLARLMGADELILTNSLIGAWPVAELEGRRWTPGPVAARLAALLDEDEA